jgi:cyclomaltodextrinase / maltogenic alpha-amylase / neopullulanase
MQPPPKLPGGAVDFTPSWARRAIWYQIFPERFCNGDPRNDPTAESIVGADHCERSPHWQIHPWTSDWYARTPAERAEGGEFWRHALRRRYGGDLQGILQRLDYLQELGVTALYLNPVFESPSLHKYDGSTFHHIDPYFGPDPAGDLLRIAAEAPEDPTTWVWTRADQLMLELIAEVHRRGMRIIFDGVFNHMGVRSWAFLDVVKHQRQSRFADWFKVTAWDDAAAGTAFAYQGWFGHPSLPELRQDAEGIVAGPRDYIFAATRRWMAPDGQVERGIDGWRLDVALQVGHGFWKAWRKVVKAINPEAYLTGEIIAEPEASRPFLRGDEFDAVMNYPFAFACHEAFFAGDGRPISELDRQLAAVRAAHPACVTAVMQNLFGSHDTARLASHAVNGPRLSYRRFQEYAEQQARATSPGFEVRAPAAAERQRMRLFVLFQMTYLGAPMIYYGDEAGMWGANDPCCRKPMVWPELRYEDEALLPDGSRRAQPDRVAFDHEWFACYRQLIAMRRAWPALSEGSFTTLLVDDERHLFVFARDLGSERIVVAINRSAMPQRVVVSPSAAPRSAASVTEEPPIDRSAPSRWRDALSGAELAMGDEGLTLALAPWWGVVAVPG